MRVSIIVSASRCHRGDKGQEQGPDQPEAGVEGGHRKENPDADFSR